MLISQDELARVTISPTKPTRKVGVCDDQVCGHLQRGIAWDVRDGGTGGDQSVGHRPPAAGLDATTSGEVGALMLVDSRFMLYNTRNGNGGSV